MVSKGVRVIINGQIVDTQNAKTLQINVKFNGSIKDYLPQLEKIKDINEKMAILNQWMDEKNKERCDHGAKQIYHKHHKHHKSRRSHSEETDVNPEKHRERILHRIQKKHPTTTQFHVSITELLQAKDRLKKVTQIPT